MHFFDTAMAASVGAVRPPSAVQVDFLTLRDRETVTLRTGQGRDSLTLLRVERRAVRRTRWLVANSPEVAGPLAAGAPRGAEVTVVPLALDPSHYDVRASLAQPVAGLIGTASWPPTASAVTRLLTSVWPLVLARRPEAQLVLAGDGMDRARFPELPDLPGVRWRGRVPSAPDFLRELGVLVYPIRAGSGTKVKVLEAMALGLPVVTAPDGAEGLQGEGGVVVEEDDAGIAASLVKLLEDVGARRAAGQAARDRFMRWHTPRVVAAPAIRLYERMLA